MREKHPYGVFIPKKPKAMIIGSFPIGKFTNPKRKGEIKPHEYDFFFGGEKNLLWKLLADIFQRKLASKKDILSLLEDTGLGIGDVIESCTRKNGSASDSDLYDIQWNEELLSIIDKHHIRTVLFTSKKVETWFNRLFPESDHVKKVLLITPSGQVLRSLPRREDFQRWLKKHPYESKIHFIRDDYALKLKHLLK
jgi:G:T/U-mismatch repair DNA glycosylase